MARGSHGSRGKSTVKSGYSGSRGNSAFMASKLIFIPIMIVVIIVIIIFVFLFSTIYSVIEKIIGKKNINIICAIFELVYACLKWFCVICVFWYSKFHKNVIVPIVSFITPFFMGFWSYVLAPIWNVIYSIFYFLYSIIYFILFEILAPIFSQAAMMDTFL